MQQHTQRVSITTTARAGVRVSAPSACLCARSHFPRHLNQRLHLLRQLDIIVQHLLLATSHQHSITYVHRQLFLLIFEQEVVLFEGGVETGEDLCENGQIGRTSCIGYIYIPPVHAPHVPLHMILNMHILMPGACTCASPPILTSFAASARCSITATSFRMEMGSILFTLKS